MKAFVTFKTKEERRLELKGINVEVTLRVTLTTFAAHLLGRGTGPATVRRPGPQTDRNSIAAMMF